MLKFTLFIALALLSFNSVAENIISRNPESIPNSHLQRFGLNSKKVKHMINLALLLASKNLGYQYGSANPKAGGMDCSGTMYFILSTLGVNGVPRSSYSLYQWVREKGRFYAVNSNPFNSLAFSHLRPGDLLFWTGTYATNHHPNVSHVMLYIGKNKAGQPLMAGASDGRTYKGRQIYGVSVFDFKLPDAHSKSRFLGYSCTPKINCINLRNDTITKTTHQSRPSRNSVA